MRVKNGRHVAVRQPALSLPTVENGIRDHIISSRRGGAGIFPLSLSDTSSSSPFLFFLSFSPSDRMGLLSSSFSVVEN